MKESIERGSRWIGYGMLLFLLCWLLANLEVQIEGANGWAAELPTWRITDSSWNWIFGGRPITGYHVFLNLLLLAFYHFPAAFTKWTWAKEAKALYGLAINAVLWDFLWFVVNPNYGIPRYNPEHIWWFRHWTFGFPTDYYVGIAVSLVVFCLPVFLKKAKFGPQVAEWAVMTSTMVLMVTGAVLIY